MLNGKGTYIWKVRHTLEVMGQKAPNYDTALIADELVKAGMTHAWIKVCDGSWGYNIYNGRDFAKELASTLRKRGISPWGWQYVYARYPELEAEVAIKRIQELDLDGFVVNAEHEYKSAGVKPARRYMSLLRRAFPDLPIGLSSYRFPRLHPEFPFDAFLEFCDFNAPQVYWMLASNPGHQLKTCIQEFKNLVKVQRPIFPTGSAYHEHGWQATAGQVQEFMETAVDLGLPGFNFWEMANCLTYMPDVWEKICGFQMTPAGGGQVDEPGTGEEQGLVHPRAKVVSQMVNIRTGPGTQFTDVGDYYGGVEVDVLDIQGTDAWIKIQENPERWIAAYHQDKRYVRLIDG
jgi:hypothetical protein